ncbi:hypothetical protein [Exercitatus varius]|uniref:Uncharacterized protein n=1 Tax=Exercitatus varius TaxID=67857 RepID=A0ABT6EN25_9PAST|nr:hypothetical protein [Exercitatus varius]MDG2939473.1 hypothetical protein [Exercitatus varius]MDG2943589.1 hypothetical protein [Exercitatus varius]MDG2944937.1 hypothetical protein [Exercitatus varius]QOF67987.1 hypothetical protein IFE17_00920 [Actinobacillus sp. GY-402]
MTYFNKPKKVNWDLKLIKPSYKAKIYFSNSERWQFSSSATVKILGVDQKNSLVTFDFSKREDEEYILDSNIEPNSGYRICTEKFNIVTLPFSYLADVVEELY